MGVLLDTTVVIDLLKERPGAVARIAALREAGSEPPYVCAVTADELFRGLRPQEVARAALVLAGFRSVPLGPTEGALAGVWRRDHARRGVTLHQPDCLIAAAAVSARVALATGNPKDFPMDGVVVEHWPVGA